MAYLTIEDTIGNTPLVQLQRIPGEGNARRGNVILGKLEGNNPAGTVKDRPALSRIKRAEARGRIKPGDTLIEATSGNTGIALAMVAAAKGYDLILTMPESMSLERRVMFKALGAKLVLTPAPLAMKGAIKKAEDIKASLGENAYMLQQFNNPDNVKIHVETTGPEIWEQTDGKIDVFLGGVGTGGTITGTSK